MPAATLHYLPDGQRDATRLGQRIAIGVHEIDVHTFPDGELRVTVAEAAPLTIVYAALDRPNEKLIALLLSSEALRRTGANRLVLVAPYMCYMRQDTAFHQGEAISQKAIGRLLASAFDRVVTVDAHLHRTKRIQDVFPGIEANDLSAVPAMAEALSASPPSDGTIIVGPDEESEPWVRDLATRLGLEHTVCRKQRHGDCSVDIVVPDPKRIANRDVLLIDDMVSSGGTLITGAQALLAAGARAIDVIITHALYPSGLSQTLLAAGIRSVRSSHSVSHPTNAIPIDRILASALRGEVS